MSKANYPVYPLMLVDDDAPVLESTERILRSAGLNHFVCCQDSRNVMEVLASREVSAVMLDLAMPYLTGQELLSRIADAYPGLPVVIVTGANEVSTAVECMKLGAVDYMVKPVEKNRLLSGVQRVLELHELRLENALLRERMFSGTIGQPEVFQDIITVNALMLSIFRYCETIAASPRPALVTGETGTGKELIARAIHTLSGRPGKFVAVNVAGLDDNMFSDTLFGHVKGAYTGADEARKGLIEQANEGTLFLDEIGDLNAMSQTKLLRLLQEREYFSLGSDVARIANVRIIVATNHDLAEAREAGRFRKDLFYRLQIHHIALPPLRERPEDIPLLVHHFLEQASQALGKKKPTAPKELFNLLNTYSFPGNVRELESLVFDAVSRHESHVLSLDSFKDRMGVKNGCPEAMPLTQNPFEALSELPTMKESNDLLIEEALRRAQGNQNVAAQLLGIQRQTLNKRLVRK